MIWAGVPAGVDSLAGSHLLPIVRGEPPPVDQTDDAQRQFEHPVRLVGNERERALLHCELDAPWRTTAATTSTPALAGSAVPVAGINGHRASGRMTP